MLVRRGRRKGASFARHVRATLGSRNERMIHLKPVLDGRGQPGREALGSQMGVRAGAVAPEPECRLA